MDFVPLDFAIAPVSRAAGPPGSPAALPAPEWAVLCLCEQRGAEVAQQLARFGHRSHAEAFLADLIGRSVVHAECRP